MLAALRKRRVRIVLYLVVIVLLLVGRPLAFLIGVVLTDRDQLRPLPRGIVDDASRLDATHISEIWDMPAGDDAEDKLRDLLARAAREHLCVSIAGARHSMGGQTIYPDGIQINMLGYHRMNLDEKQNLLEVQSGARWAEIVPYLDRHARSVEVMQSNDSFSVGGSLSVNCHGWQPESPPIASTVESFRLMKAHGTVVRCSRAENSELFSLVLGGYGLFGVILDVRLHVVPNERYEVHQFVMRSDEFLPAWKKRVDETPEVGMAVGRLSIVPDDFLNEAILYTFNRVPEAGKLPPVSSLGLEELTRTLFRGSVESDYGKKLRWEAETELVMHLAKRFLTRNQLMDEPVEFLANRKADSTDILQEYFVPRGKLNEFVDRMRGIIPRNKGNLTNVTLRHVMPDNDSFMRYADGDMMAVVVLFNQKMTAEDAGRMRLMTQQLIDAAVVCGGRYYLPYRLEASEEEFQRAYPQAKRFFDLKRQYDPGELFENQFYLRYGKEDVK